ncbi:hypothetical protein C8Q70DRAFT_1049985 [Cubamyces menziesii]|uniref:Uncharacterized protein n=1 Tax=Trametes cubensis TaxID=1111947 RepID=A0AAD7U2U5_9APHY|nr:hypothetical protein C8Q70DRAFT_1049985 [Cubamyces menziesii]KAJ8496061.1 hypothetical protein ONZ51_g1321 [Trametes cubensis]
MNTYTTTKLFGGKRGDVFRDIFVLDANGKLLVNGPEEKPELDVNHPIQKIVVYSHSKPLSGMSVTYQLANGGNITLSHGYQQGPLVQVVEFNANERLAGVFGRVLSFDDSHAGDLILSLGFVIFNASTGAIRVVNPPGTPNKQTPEVMNPSPRYIPFYVSDVLAFGGFDAPDTEEYTRIEGLFFYKNVAA